MARVYHLEALGAFSPEARRQTYGLAVVDSVLNTSRVAGGLAGAWSQIDPDGIHRTWTDVRVALAMPLGDHLSLGATGRWLRVEQAVGAGPFGPSLASDGTRNSPIFNSITFDAGATASILDGLRIAVVGHNLTNPGTGLAPTTASAGVGYANGVVSLEADGMLDFTTWGSTRSRVMLGGELFVAERYALRAGYDYDAGMKLGTASLGAGYIDPKWSIELGVRHDLIDAHASTLAVLSLRYFYDPLGAATPTDEPDSM
jgi:hypothetical protein